ncbi:MAG TPA: isochorismatase family cysteine hydrolase [Chloroflexota bacterium]|jgi:nicotinamidase-related amidase|nr:isochorismatase family cysteine hydrolase [Chloroflexota bacterium]
MPVDREKLAAVADPRRSALVVVDMQNDFCNPADYPESVPMLPRLQRFIAESRRAGVQVIFTQVNHDSTNDSMVWVSRRAPGRKDIVKAGTPGAAYHTDFEPQPGDIDIVKHRYSAFIGTPLEMNLRTLGIQTLFMTGIATNVCVESTLRDAFQRDFYVVLVEDCCAAGTRALHDGTVENTRRHFGGLVATSDEVVEVWSQVAAPV